VNQREWLDLPETILSQFPGASRELKFQYVADQTAPGGLFDGFTVAISADITALAQSAGIDLSTFNYATNAGPTLALGTLLGFTFEPGNGSKCAIGLLDELASLPFVDRIGATLCIVPTSQAGIDIGVSDLLYDPVPAVLLFRPIPEPATASLLIWLAVYRLKAKCTPQT
jgi:hypothetical protein